MGVATGNLSVLRHFLTCRKRPKTAIAVKVLGTITLTTNIFCSETRYLKNNLDEAVTAMLEPESYASFQKHLIKRE